MARPQVELDYKTLDGLCKLQCTGEECASVLGVDYDTLNAALQRDGNECFSEYLKKVGSGGKASLRRMQWKSAENGNATMQIWLGKQYLNQADKIENNTNLRTAPLEELSDEALEAIIVAGRIS